MRSEMGVARILGALVVLHLATGLITPYVLLQPLSAAPAGDLGLAAAMEDRVRLAVAMLVAGGLVPLAMAITLRPALEPGHAAAGHWLLALAGVSLAMQLVECQHYLSLLSLSLLHGQAPPDSAPLLAATAPMVRAAWRWAHYTHLLSVVGWVLLFTVVLFRVPLVPRALAAAGIVTTLMQLAGITLPVLLGYRVPFPQAVWGMPLALAYLGIALWLIIRGFSRPSAARD